jgi:hypothetical protein
MHADDTPTMTERLAAYTAVLETAPGHHTTTNGRTAP